jgi:hypothetical protein
VSWNKYENIKPSEQENTSGQRRARREALKRSPACDCIASGNVNKPKQHGADPHAKNCAIYIERQS